MEGTATAVENTIPSILEALGGVSDFLIDKMGDFVQLTLEQPLLMIPIGVVLTLTGVKLFKVIF